jgi:hypothetical protein
MVTSYRLLRKKDIVFLRKTIGSVIYILSLSLPSNRKCLAQIDVKSLLCIILSLLAVTMIFCPTYSFSTGGPGFYNETGKNTYKEKLLGRVLLLALLVSLSSPSILTFRKVQLAHVFAFSVTV